MKRSKNLKEVFHLYEFRVKNKKIRNGLLNHLIKKKRLNDSFVSIFEFENTIEYFKFEGKFTIACSVLALPSFWSGCMNPPFLF